jgi:N-acetylglucosamine malate deacetylase 1
MSTNKKLTIAAFGAHPDDLEISMFGTMMKYAEQGHTVHLIVATDGRRAGTIPGEENAAIRKREAEAAAALIGLAPRFLELVNGHTFYAEDTFTKIDKTLEVLQPDLIFTHDINDYHPEHRLLARLVTDAAWAPVFLADTMAGVDFVPQYYVDITAQFPTKQKAILTHESQNPANLARAAEIQNRFRGLQCNLKGKIAFAEAYRIFGRAGSMKAYELLPE